MSSDGAGRILMVDDTEINLRVLAGILDKAGYESVSTMDGDDAIAMAHSYHPDLILLDIMMPGRDGFDVCAELKADPRTMEIPIIFLSGRADSADKVRGLQAGAVDYMTKPFDRAEVLARVEVHISLRRMTSALIQANDDLVDRQRLLDEDLRAAAEVQRALIYKGRPGLPGLTTAGRFVPCSTVGGDLYNGVQLSDTSSALWMLDVSGHGVPSALVSMCAGQSLTPMGGFVLTPERQPARPSDVMNALDAEYPFERFEKFFTAAYVVIDAATGALTHTSAGHPPPLLVRANGTVLALEEGGALVGSGIGRYEQGEQRLVAGDRVLLYTDGVTEHESPEHLRFGDGRLIEVLVQKRRGTLDAVCNGVMEALAEFGKGLPFADDVSLFAFEYTGDPR